MMSLVGQDEAMSAIERYFQECYVERRNAEMEEEFKAFMDEYDTLVALFSTPRNARTAYQRALMDEIKENEQWRQRQ